MPHHLPVLSRTSVIAISFAAMVLLGGLLRQTGAALGGMLDLTLTGAEARALLDRLTPWQRDVHAHATLLYDGLYPLAYGAFFAGLAVRLGGAKARWIALVMLQVTAGVFSGSQALIADGIHSLSDLISDFVVLLAGHHSRKQADDDHQYGHQRYETAASLALGALLLPAIRALNLKFSS